MGPHVVSLEPATVGDGWTLMRERHRSSPVLSLKAGIPLHLPSTPLLRSNAVRWAGAAACVWIAYWVGRRVPTNAIQVFGILIFLMGAFLSYRYPTQSLYVWAFTFPLLPYYFGTRIGPLESEDETLYFIGKRRGCNDRAGISIGFGLSAQR